MPVRVADHQTALPWKPPRDLCYIRELPVEQEGLIISGVDLNRSPDLCPILQGIVEAVGPQVIDLQPGDHVWFDIGAGEFRVPGDGMVRIMYEGCVMVMERPCRGIELGDGNYSGCDQSAGDCPVCGL